MTLVEVLQEVPAPAWGLGGAIVGVVGTLSASWLSNRSNDRRFSKQLNHDAEQKAKDRVGQLRRDVYLCAVDELVSVNAFMGRLATIDPTDVEAISTGFLGFMKATARVQAVANEVTRHKVAELSGAYGRLYMELLADAAPAHVLKLDIDINRESYANLHAERVRLVSAMREENEGVSSKFKFEALSKSFERTSRSIEAVSQEYLDLSARHNAALASFSASTARKVVCLSELQAEVSALLRAEFDLDADLEGMKAQFREQGEQARSASETYLAKLKAELAAGE